MFQISSSHGKQRQRMLCRPLLLIVWLGGAWIGCSPVAGASGNATELPPRYHVRRWTTEHGLPQNRISCLEQTRDGYLWIGTWDGLVRFDGVRFTLFDTHNTPELVNDAINALAEDSDGTLWIGTADGLVSYRDHRFNLVATTELSSDRKIWQLVRSSAGGVWLKAGDQASRLKDGKFSKPWRVFPSPRYFGEGPDGRLHVIDRRSWLSLSATADEMRTNHVGEPSAWDWSAALPDFESGGLWVGTPEGLYRSERGAWKQVKGNGLSPGGVSFLRRDSRGVLWAHNREAGVYRGVAGQWTVVDVGERIAPAGTVCMKEDREGNIWLGTDDGLVQLRPHRMRTYTTRDGLPGNHIWSVCEGTDGTVWVGGDRRLSRIQKGHVVPLSAEEPSNKHPNRSVWPTSRGGVWIGKAGIGVLEFTESFMERLPLNEMPGPTPAALYEDSTGKIWIGTERGVVVFKDGAVTAQYTNPPYNVRCILADRKGNLWFGTKGQGLIRLSEGKREVITVENGVGNENIWALYEDADGSLWIGTDQGLTCGMADQFFNFGQNHGVQKNPIYCILEDDFGYLWLSGPRGIHRANREQLNAVVRGQSGYAHVASFGTADGMESSECNGENQPAGWKGRNGHLWFPTKVGLVEIDPQRVPTNEMPPLVAIEQVRADEEVIFGHGCSTSQKGSQSLVTSAATRLGAGKGRVMEIRYTATALTAPELVRFKYKLKPNDSDWRDGGGQRVVFLANLRPGNYTFRVKACDRNGVWSKTPASFAFSLAPHFWQTWPFYIFCAAGLALGSLAIHHRRVSFLRQIERLEAEQALNNERARIARDLHDELGSRLTALAMHAELLGRNGNNSEKEDLRALGSESRALAERMRDVIWTVDPTCDSLEALVGRLTTDAEDFLSASGIRLRLVLPDEIPPAQLTADARHQITMVAKEALHNVIKHAAATEVHLALEIRDGKLWLAISDNGVGLQRPCGNGRGLANMRSRIEGLGGSFTIDSKLPKGTSIHASVPLTKIAPQLI